MKKFWHAIGKGLKTFHTEVIKFPGYIMGHPLKGFEEMKRYKRGKMWIAILFVVLLVILKIWGFQSSGFVVNNTSIRDFHSLSQVVYFGGGVVILTVANWACTTLFDGKGNMKDIFMMVCYSLYPLIWTSLIGIILSNVITFDEISIYNLVNGIGIFLTCYMLFFGIISVHEYGLGQCLGTVLLTIVAIMIILFVGVLLFDLFQRVYAFFYQIWQELTLRT